MLQNSTGSLLRKGRGVGKSCVDYIGVILFHLGPCSVGGKFLTRYLEVAGSCAEKGTFWENLMEIIISFWYIQSHWLWPAAVVSRRHQWYSQEQSEKYQGGLQSPRSSSKGLRSTGSFFISPPNGSPGDRMKATSFVSLVSLQENQPVNQGSWRQGWGQAQVWCSSGQGWNRAPWWMSRGHVDGGPRWGWLGLITTS